MCRPIIEEMALIGKSLDINTALRAACGAAKMLALSEGVECPYTIDNAQFKNQCPTPFDPKLPQTDNFEEMHRIYVFLKAVQQGIQPPINIARLPEDEENELIREIDTVSKAFNALPNKNDLTFANYFFSNIFKITPTENSIREISDYYQAFITLNGTSETPLLAFNCNKIQSNFENQLDRLFGLLKNGAIYTQQTLENYAATFNFEKDNGFKPGGPLAIYATKDINKIIVKISTEKTTDMMIAITSITPLLVDTETLDNIYYVQIIKDAIVSYPPTFGIVNIRTQTAFKYMFDHNLVVDVQPYLMYLLQTDKWAYENIMASSFGGNMTPQQYPLAFYIVAHYVANQPLYSKNPADFYQKPIADKKKEMLAALKTNKTELTQLIADGYTWLGEPNPGIGKLLTSFGGSFLNVSGHRIGSVVGKAGAGLGKAGAAIRGVFTQSQAKKPGTGQAGGRRVTRKVRILPVNG